MQTGPPTNVRLATTVTPVLQIVYEAKYKRGKGANYVELLINNRRSQVQALAV